jgi:hypothetical protein
MAIHFRACSAAFIILPLVVGCTAPESPCPQQNIGVWSAQDEPEVYVGDELFIYINGGAEIYHEYGFVQVAVQRYRRGDDTVAVEIYTMEGDAFGIYSFARSSTGHAVNLGDGGTSADYFIHFWSGPDLAVITAENEFEDLGEAVSEIATAVAGCLRPGGVEPSLLDQLPIEGRATGSEVYLTGRLAFMNVARPAALLFAGFEEGAAARYEFGEHIAVLRWGDDAAAAQALQEARQLCVASGGAVIETEDGGVIEFESGGHRISAGASHDLITLRVQEEEP